MNTGIQDAYNLAWKLVLVLRGQADAALLETYHEERLANAKHLLRTTDQFFDVATGRQWLLKFFRDNLLPGVINAVSHVDKIKAAIFPTLSMITINYRDASLSQHTGDALFDVKAGDRMPYFLVDGESGFEKLTAPCFHLLIFSDGEVSYESLKHTLETEYGSLMDVNIIPLYPKITDTFDADEPFMVLLRPDNYIGLLTTTIDPAGIRDYLRQVIGLTQPQLS